MSPTYQIEMQEAKQQYISYLDENHRVSTPYTSMDQYSPYAIYSKYAAALAAKAELRVLFLNSKDAKIVRITLH